MEEVSELGKIYVGNVSIGRNALSIDMVIKSKIT